MTAPASADRLPFALREATLDDRPFITDTWLLSVKDSQAARQAGRHYVAWHKAEMRDVLSWPSTVVRVCCPDDDQATILGWAAIGQCAPVRLYYVYVRHAARRLGIARLLLAGLETQELLCAARLPRERDGEQWRVSALAAKVPPTWHYVPGIMNHAPTTAK